MLKSCHPIWHGTYFDLRSDKVQNIRVFNLYSNGYIINWMLNQIFHVLWYSETCSRLNLRDPPSTPYSITFPPTGWTNWPINEFLVSILKWRNYSPVIESTYILHPFISIILYHLSLSKIIKGLSQLLLPPWRINHLKSVRILLLIFIEWHSWAK